MKFSPTKFIRSRYPLAIIAGLLLASSFPKPGIAGFAWVAPGLMLAAALGKAGGASFRIGYVAGLVHYLVSLRWLLLIPVTGFPILGWVVLSAFLALFPAMWVWLALKVSGFGSRVSSLEKEPEHALGTRNSNLETLLPRSWALRTLWALACAAIWVALEMILARVFGGFPWNLLGASQYQITPLIQIASFAGVYGVSFLIVWVSVSLLSAMVRIVSDPAARSAQMIEIILPLLVSAAAFAWGFHQLRNSSETTRHITVTLIQPSIPQTLIWNPENDAKRFEDLLQLSGRALTNQTDVLIWPEAAMPGLPRYESELLNPVLEMARAHHVWMIIGADDAEKMPSATNYFNASLLISPGGELVANYRKRSLVIFGEYIPLQRWLPFIKWFTPVTDSYTPGTKPVQFILSNPHAQTSVLICFEDVFPQLARASVETNTDFLVNITNDGWFGQSSAQWQHAASASFRAVENGLPLVRCANNGLTCWIDANGRIRQIFHDEAGSIYGAGFLTFDLPLPASGEGRQSTFYTRHGDVLGWTCVGISAAMLAITRFRKRATAGS